jgi:ligand-binding sensor domain-containing protein
MTKLKIATAVFFFFTFSLVFDFAIAGSKWINYTDMKNVSCLSVDTSNKIVYCGTTGGLFVADLTNGTILNKYTNINGLTSNTVTALTIDNQNRLWIGASDGSICILDYKSLTYKYIYDIKNSTETDKEIYGFTTYGNNIFASTGFGIIKISSSTLNFVDAPYYQLGSFSLKTKVYDLTILNNVIYAATASGIAYASLLNSNLNNPSSWSNYNSSPLNSNVRTIKSFNGKIFAGADGGFMYFNGTDWLSYPNSNYSSAAIINIAPVGDKLFFIANNYCYYAPKDTLANVYLYYSSNNSNVIASGYNQSPLIGVYEKGLYATINNTMVYIAPNCPNRNSINYVTEDGNGNLWVASGLNEGGFFKYDGSTWTNYTTETFPLIGSGGDCRKIITRNNEVWALFWGTGATLIINDYIHNFNTSNSPLRGISTGSSYCVPYGGAFDNNGYFWMAFYGTNNSKYLYAYTGDTNFVGFTNPSYFTDLSHFNAVAIDNYNTKWIVTTGGTPGLYFFNENGPIKDSSINIYGIYYTSDFTEVSSITHVIVDKNNSVWITTDNGAYILDNPYGAIQNPNSKPSFTKMSIISGNLKVPFTESCTTIASDVLNEKWIGTKSSGVFHLSEDGSTLIETFNVTNSPLLYNEITSITVSSKSGRAYFGTLYGLSSVQTNAVQPVESFDKIVCKPNPYVIPSSKNPTLTIDGLVENSTIKIITLNGEVIAEYTARAGKIDDQWNGTDKKGKLVPTGIYIIVAYNKDGSKVGTGKLAVIRR